jgi:hypothetical protein
MTNSLNLILIKICLIIIAGIVFYSCNKEVSVTPPDALPPNGYLYIDSNPRGFNIYLNNIPRGRATPDSLKWLTTGTYLVTLKKEFYKDTSITVSVVEGIKSSVYLDFLNNQSMRGNIYCTSYPVNAAIFINDSSTGKVTPYTFNVLPGQYNINYKLKNHRDAGAQVTLTSGNNVTAKAVLVDTTLWTDYATENIRIPSSSFTCIATSPGDVIYVGTTDVLFFSYDESKHLLIPYHGTLSQTVNCLKFDKQGALYAGTTGGVVYLLGTSFLEYGPAKIILPNYNIRAISFDNESTVFLGTDKGLCLMNGSVISNASFINEGKNITPVINALSTDDNGNVWAGLNSYGIAENSSSGTWTIFPASSTGLINNYITTLTSSSSGEIWAGFARQGAYGNGLSYYNGSTWIKNFSIPSSSTAKSIYIDKNNVKWVGTDEGLIMFSSPGNATIFNYDNTGLDINNIQGVTGDSYGNIWIATKSGIYKYKGNH